MRGKAGRNESPLQDPRRNRPESRRAERAAGRRDQGATPMGTPAQTILTPAATGQAPAEPVPVAILARTSTLALQDPVASLSRQIRSCQAWLPPGWYVAGHYWDIESGGLDIEQRSQGDGYRQFADAGLPRDGGLADLLAEAKAPVPRFAAVVC